MSLLLIGGVAALGYLLNRNGRGSRLTSESIRLPANAQPAGPNIYVTDRVSEVSGLVKDMAKTRYPQPQSFGPNPFVAFDIASKSASISALTGQPMDLSHSNMQPHFGAVKKQASGLVDIGSTRKLEMYGATVQPQAKTERLNSSLIPQNLDPLLLHDAPLRQERMQNELSQTRSDMQLPQARETRTITDDLRVLPKNTTQLRAANNPLQDEYQNILTPGKMGETRAMTPAPQKNRYDYYSDGNTRQAQPSLSGGAQRSLAPQHLIDQDKHREVFESHSYGPATMTGMAARNEGDRAAMAATVGQRAPPKREFCNENAAYGAPQGRRAGALGTHHIVAQTKRDQKGTRIQPPTSSINREALIGVMEVASTSRDMIGDQSEYININPKLPQSQQKQMHLDFEIPMTAREMNGDNMHLGPAHSGLNLPATVQDYDLDGSSKEQLLQDDPHYGNAGSAHQQRKAEGEWTTSLEDREMDNRLGGGFAPLGQAVRTTDPNLRDERDQRNTYVNGGKSTTMGGRTQFRTTLKQDARENRPAGADRQPVRVTPIQYPLVTRSREKEAMNNRILAPHTNITGGREMGRLRPQELS